MKNYEIKYEKKFLVIGYGNSLRNDDGAGQKVAEKVAQWNLNNVTSLAVHQLTPELSEPISHADTVIFVDAVLTSGKPSEKLQIHPLKINPKKNNLGHHSHPSELLSLTQEIYQKIPTAYWILIPAVNFEFGETLSLLTDHAAKLALETIRAMIEEI